MVLRIAITCSPGTGKSTLVQKAAKASGAKGTFCLYFPSFCNPPIHDQSNPNSLALLRASFASASRFSDFKASPRFFQAVA